MTLFLHILEGIIFLHKRKLNNLRAFITIRRLTDFVLHQLLKKKNLNINFNHFIYRIRERKKRKQENSRFSYFLFSTESRKMTEKILSLAIYILPQDRCHETLRIRRPQLR